MIGLKVVNASKEHSWSSGEITLSNGAIISLAGYTVPPTHKAASAKTKAAKATLLEFIHSLGYGGIYIDKRKGYYRIKCTIGQMINYSAFTKIRAFNRADILSVYTQEVFNHSHHCKEKVLIISTTIRPSLITKP